mgnify:CR=1 FL=1
MKCMRKIVLFMVMSLDGFIAGSQNELDFEIRDEEIGRFLIPDLLQTVDSMVMGHELYKGFFQAWPAMAKNSNSPADLVEFAHWVENSPKYVFSHTAAESLDNDEWKNTIMIEAQSDEEVVAEIAKLKQSPGKDITLFGGVRLAQTLVRLGLVDEYRFKIQPIALGSGQPLFKDLAQRMSLKLTFSKVFESGVIALYYVPKQ